MTPHDANAAIDALAARIWHLLDDAQQIAFYTAWQPRGQPEDAAAGLAYLEAVAAGLPHDAPDLDAAALCAMPARLPERASDRWRCGCGAYKNPKSATCRVCYLARHSRRAA